jgi:AcrR family transcriptional regulator
VSLSSAERRKKEKENRKNAILKTARKLFFDKGFKSVTIDNIAAKAGLSKGSIYLCFDSKEEIYFQVLIADNIETYKKNSYYLEKEATASELLLEYAQNYVDSFLGNNELFRILMTFMLHSDQMNLTEEQNRELIRTTNDNIQVVSELLQKGINTGEFSAPINFRQTQIAIWGLLNGVIALYLFTGNPAKRPERIHTTVKESMNVFLKGLKA